MVTMRGHQTRKACSSTATVSSTSKTMPIDMRVRVPGRHLRSMQDSPVSALYSDRHCQPGGDRPWLLHGLRTSSDLPSGCWNNFAARHRHRPHHHCPYHPTHGIGKYQRESFDRKPNPGMILRRTTTSTSTCRGPCCRRQGLGHRGEARGWRRIQHKVGARRIREVCPNASNSIPFTPSATGSCALSSDPFPG